MPTIPPLYCSGKFPGFDADAWYGLLVPAGTSPAIVERIRGETVKALQLADVQAATTRLGLATETSTAAELGAFGGTLSSGTLTLVETPKNGTPPDQVNGRSRTSPKKAESIETIQAASEAPAPL